MYEYRLIAPLTTGNDETASAMGSVTSMANYETARSFANGAKLYKIPALMAYSPYKYNNTDL